MIAPGRPGQVELPTMKKKKLAVRMVEAALSFSSGA